MELKVDNSENEATIEIQVRNNHTVNVSEVVVVGRIPFEGNTFVIQGENLKSEFTTTMVKKQNQDVIILDPPRSGIHPRLLEHLLEISPKRIIYVSCNPTTQARDLTILKEKYNILEVSPVDMFPHTYHIETITKLEKK